ncbi:TPA: hypothetical protein EYP66_25655 [Candidatus Poribacteria bacterium]|nr:hypothetical protein [Candidatus Poribacteria bacterium]
MIRIALPIIFLTFLNRIPTHVAPYFILIFAVISVIMALIGIRRGFLYYYDPLNIIMFSAVFIMWALSPNQAISWTLRYGKSVLYPVLALATIAPPILSYPRFRIIWKGEYPHAPMPFVVLWGSTFILASVMLWLGAPVRTPILIIVLLTLPMRISLAREFNITKRRNRWIGKERQEDNR